MSGQLAHAAPRPGPGSSERLREVARSGFRNLVQIVPGAVGRGLLGGLKGLLLYGVGAGLLGLGGALIGRLRWELPWWLVAVNAVVPMIALGAAGAYASGLRSALLYLAEQMERRGVIRALYALLRPTLLKAARSAEGAARPVTERELAQKLRQSVLGRLRECEAPEDVRRSLGERLSTFVAGRLQRQLVFGVLGSLAAEMSAGASAEEMEQSGLAQLERALSELIVDLFELQARLALAVAFVVSVLPTVLYVLVARPG
jgi:hypothetical protein